MKVVIAVDSFKGTLTSHEACAIIAEALRERLGGAEIVCKPMADGGEGTARAMIEAGDGRWVSRTVMGPLPSMRVEAGFAWFDRDRRALVEMASASGVELLRREQMNPLETTTYGTGELIREAVAYGAREVLLAVGGSATVDGGVGAATALGWRFLDSDGQAIALGGGDLGRIETIVAPDTVGLPGVRVLCDVDNPLCGPHGAARVYGPQKGADAAMVERLEGNLLHLAEVVKRYPGADIVDLRGAGAAGGLSAGAVAFMDAEIVSGIKTVIECSGLIDELADADWVITGEGAFDQQSLRGKVVAGVAAAAMQAPVQLGVIAGQVNLPEAQCASLGIAKAVSCMTDGMSLDEALRDCRGLLREATLRFVDGAIG